MAVLSVLGVSGTVVEWAGSRGNASRGSHGVMCRGRAAPDCHGMGCGDLSRKIKAVLAASVESGQGSVGHGVAVGVRKYWTVKGGRVTARQSLRG